QNRHIEGLPLGTRGGMLVTHTFPLDGEYEFAVTANGIVAPGGRGNGVLVGGGGDGFGGKAGAAESAPRLNITLDNERLTFANPRSFKFPVKAGPHTLGIALIDRRPSAGAGVDDIYSVYAMQGAVNNVIISGPFNPAGVGDTPSRQRIFVCYPE